MNIPADLEEAGVALEKVALGLVDPDAIASLNDEPEVCGDGGNPQKDGDADHDRTYEQESPLKVIL